MVAKFFTFFIFTVKFTVELEIKVQIGADEARLILIGRNSC